MRCALAGAMQGAASLPSTGHSLRLGLAPGGSGGAVRTLLSAAFSVCLREEWALRVLVEELSLGGNTG